METPIFRLIEEELKSYRETIDTVLNKLNELDPCFKDKLINPVYISSNIIDEDIYPLSEKISILSFKVHNFPHKRED